MISIRNLKYFLIARTISSVGTFLTASSIPLFLVESKRAAEIPMNSFLLSAAIVLASLVIVPYLKRYSSGLILIVSSLTGFFLFTLLGLLLFLEGALHSHSLQLLYFITFLSTLLMTLDTNISQPYLGEKCNTGRLIHLDSALSSLSRAICPTIAAVILVTFYRRLDIILWLDAATFFIAGAIYLKSVGYSEPSIAPISASSTDYGILASLKKFWKVWVVVSVVAMAAGIFNVGAVAHAAHVGLSVSEVSYFMAIQNVVIFLTNLLLTRYPAITRRVKVIAPLFAALGMFQMANAHSLTELGFGTTLMAFGMIVFIQGVRAEFATTERLESEKRQDLATFSILNSLLSLGFGMVCIQFSTFVPWSILLKLGSSIFIFASILCYILLRTSKWSLQKCGPLAS